MNSSKLLTLLLAVSACLYAEQSVYDFSLAAVDGKEVPLKAYAGKVLLIVNVASQTIYSDQLPKLDTLYRTYAPQGLVVLGIPSDDFGHAEPGKADKLPVTFPTFAKAALTGKDPIPLYEYLTDAKLNPKTGGELPWNFTKYLIGRDGKPVARFDAGTPPDSPELMAAVEAALEKK
jgi:glutathione peroxidase